MMNQLYSLEGSGNALSIHTPGKKYHPASETKPFADILVINESLVCRGLRQQLLKNTCKSVVDTIISIQCHDKYMVHFQRPSVGTSHLPC